MSCLELNADFRDILAALADAGAEFVLIGGRAVAAHRQEGSLAAGALG